MRKPFGIGELLSTLAGGLLTFAFAPFYAYWLAPLCVAALFYLWQDLTPWRAAWRGFLFGLAHYGGGVYWITISLHSYGGAPLAFALLATLLLVLYMALYPALLGYGLNRLIPTAGARRWLLAAPASWVLLEWLRSWLLSGFPWLSLGYSQSDGPLAGLAPLAGVFGLSWAVLLSAGLLLMLASNAARAVFKPVAGGALIALLAGGWAFAQVRWTTPAGPPLRVGLVQGNVEQRQKFLPEVLERTLLLYVEQSLPLAPDHDVIVWPETAIPTFFDRLDEKFLAALHRQAAQTDTDYLSGIPAGDWRNRQYYNAVVKIGAEPGEAPAFYHKRRLLPFGEYLPLRSVFNLFHRFVDIPLADFSRGADEQTLLTAGGQPVGVSICFEAAFGSEIRRALPQATWLTNVSNDGWFGDSLAAHQHLQMARLRALESGRPMARATNTGISALIDADGRLLARAPQFQATTLSGELQPRSGATPYVRWGDWPVLTGALIALLNGCARRRAVGQ